MTIDELSSILIPEQEQNESIGDSKRRGGAIMTRKTKLMDRVEGEHQRPLERLLPDMVNEYGLSATADRLSVSKATLGYWLLKLGISVQRVALAPGESLEVKRSR